MLAVVPDVNVLVSAVISRSTPPGRILVAWERGELTFITSPAIISKLGEVLRRPQLLPYLVARFSPERVDERIRELLRSLARQARVTPGALKLRVVENDPEDDSIIIAAVEGRADCIISGDAHLKNLKAYQGVPILSPAEFVEQYRIP